MTVAVAGLVVGVEALGHQQVELVLGAGHGDGEQAALLLDLLGRAGRPVRGNAAVDDVEDVDGLPLLALGGMDVGEDQVVLVEPGCGGFVAGGVRRIEREVGQEGLARGVAAGDLRELGEIAGADLGVFMGAGNKADLGVRSGV